MLDLTHTVQIEEVVWLVMAAYAVGWVHFRAQREAAQDEQEAVANNTHLPERTRRNATYLARARKTLERRLLAAQLLFAVAGLRGLFYAPPPDRPRAGSVVAIVLLVAGELLIVLASQAMSRARQLVRRGQV